MDKKYELVHDDSGLFRSQARRDFGDVYKGELCGLAEGENHLSHYGNTWVFGRVGWPSDRWLKTTASRGLSFFLMSLST